MSGKYIIKGSGTEYLDVIHTSLTVLKTENCRKIITGKTLSDSIDNPQAGDQLQLVTNASKILVEFNDGGGEVEVYAGVDLFKQAGGAVIQNSVDNPVPITLPYNQHNPLIVKQFRETYVRKFHLQIKVEDDGFDEFDQYVAGDISPNEKRKDITIKFVDGLDVSREYQGDEVQLLYVWVCEDSVRAKAQVNNLTFTKKTTYESIPPLFQEKIDDSDVKRLNVANTGLYTDAERAKLLQLGVIRDGVSRILWRRKTSYEFYVSYYSSNGYGWIGSGYELSYDYNYLSLGWNHDRSKLVHRKGIRNNLLHNMGVNPAYTSAVNVYNNEKNRLETKYNAERAAAQQLLENKREALATNWTSSLSTDTPPVSHILELGGQISFNTQDKIKIICAVSAPADSFFNFEIIETIYTD